MRNTSIALLGFIAVLVSAPAEAATNGHSSKSTGARHMRKGRDGAVQSERTGRNLESMRLLIRWTPSERRGSLVSRVSTHSAAVLIDTNVYWRN